jgi:GAF domain-containing protein
MTDAHELSSAALNEAVAALAQVMLHEESLDAVLNKVATLAKQVIPQAAGAALTLIGDRATTVASSGELATELDERQYTADHGPCLQAARTGQPVYVPDMTAEERWPDYVPQALTAGILSSLSLPLPLRESHAALNIYALSPHGFPDESQAIAQSFATYAAVAVGNADTYSKTAVLAEQLQQAMVSRATIEQAKGILIAERGCTADEAFDILVKMSQASNRKLRELAESLVQVAQQRTT